MEGAEPKIIAFVCNYCSYAAADLAGTIRLGYPSTVRIVRVPCSGRISPLFILKAFEQGADGVLVGGCHPGDCHFVSGNYYARRRWFVFRSLLDYLGIDSRRIWFSWVSASEARKFADLIEEFTEELRKLGPFEGYKMLRSEIVFDPNKTS